MKSLTPFNTSPTWTENMDSSGWDILQRRGLLWGVVYSGVIPTLLVQSPQYEGQFQVLIPPGVTQKVATSGKLLQTQVEVLGSFRVLAPILKEIQTEVPNLDYEELVNHLPKMSA